MWKGIERMLGMCRIRIAAGRVGRVGLAVFAVAALVLPVGLRAGQGPHQNGQQTPQQAPPQPSPAAQSDNPFPDQTQKPAPPEPEAKPAGGGDNPFPGEDTNAPIIPVDQPGESSGRPGSGSESGSGADDNRADRRPQRRDADPDGDPVRTPDPAGLTETDGFSSSRSGLPSLPVEDDNDAKPGKSTKTKTREQVIQEDLDVGGFYLEKKSWKAAQGRFSAAMALDGENAEAVFGLAEAERHLGLYKEAAQHYQLFITYDPDGPHGRAARKGLAESESAQAGAKGSDPTPAPK